MRKLIITALFIQAFFLALRFVSELPAVAQSGTAATASQNGDINGDGRRDISDAISILNWLFQDGSPPVALAASADLETRIQALEAVVDAEVLRHLSVVDIDDGQGGTRKTIRLSDVNLQIVNGLGATNGNPSSRFDNRPSSTVVNGLGNLIIGYQDARLGEDDQRTGSHNVVVGNFQNYTSFGGLVAGSTNHVSGPYSSVSGGAGNFATGAVSSVSGGSRNKASGDWSSVTAGSQNEASGDLATVSGGKENEASGDWSSVTAGSKNQATGDLATVSGGHRNRAEGDWSSVSGGGSLMQNAVNIASGDFSSVSGGGSNHASGIQASISGGFNNDAIGPAAAISGGRRNSADGNSASVSGGCDRSVVGDCDWRAGAQFEDL